MSQQPPTANPATIWTLPVLSALAIIALSVAAFTHGIDWAYAIDSIFFILAGNGLAVAIPHAAVAAARPIVQQLETHLQQHAQPQTGQRAPTALVLPKRDDTQD